MERPGRIRIGTSGWHYDHWRGPFYPADARAPDMLRLYRRDFDTVELNNSFYRLPSPATFEGWKCDTPPDFLFAVKGSRYLTHMKKLKDPEEGLESFLASARRLGRKLGPVLFQLPPGWKADPERLEAFLKALPRRGRYAFEFRNATWHAPAILELLRARNAAFCIYDLAGFLSPLAVTADFVYARLHGPGRRAYQGSYPTAALKTWARRVRAWSRERDVYIYFDNDQRGYAPKNALALRRMLGLRTSSPS